MEMLVSGGWKQNLHCSYNLCHVDADSIAARVDSITMSGFDVGREKGVYHLLVWLGWCRRGDGSRLLGRVEEIIFLFLFLISVLKAASHMGLIFEDTL